MPIREPRVPLAIVVAGLVALVGLSAPALGQLTVVDLSITTESAGLELDPGQEGTVEVTLTNDGSQSGTASLSVQQTGEGWSGTLSNDEVTVPPGGSTTVDLVVTSPGDREGATDGALTVAGTITDDSGQFSASDEATVAGSLTPPPPPPADPFPWLEVVGASVGGLGLIAAGAGGWFLRRRETGIAIDVAPETEVRPGGEGYVPIRVANTSKRPRIAELELDGLPGGWGGGLNRSPITLEPHEEADLWLALKPPSDAEEAVHDVVITARWTEARFSKEEANIQVTVFDGARGVVDNPSRTLIAPIGVPSADPYEDQQVLGDD